MKLYKIGKSSIDNKGLYAAKNIKKGTKIINYRGKIITKGKIASLMEIGAGFHGELTGRQNILLHGVILGMSREEIKRSTSAIIEFSEIQSAIDEPLRTYSSGMIARLGFSIIIHAASDILLIDEVLAVGDEKFQKKCILS